MMQGVALIGIQVMPRGSAADHLGGETPSLQPIPASDGLHFYVGSCSTEVLFMPPRPVRGVR
jgi:hypothetical protein